jgi:hypothetical protein
MGNILCTVTRPWALGTSQLPLQLVPQVLFSLVWSGQFESDDWPLNMPKFNTGDIHILPYMSSWYDA